MPRGLLPYIVWRVENSMASITHRKVYLIAEQLRSEVPGGIGTHTKAILSRLSGLQNDYPEVDLEIVATKIEGEDPLKNFNLPIRYLPVSHNLFMRFSEARVPVLGGRGGIYHSFSMYVPPVSKRSQTKVCTVHDLAFLSYPSFFTRRGLAWHKRQLRMILKGKFPIITVSEVSKASLVSSGVDVQRIHLVESGADHLGPPDHAGYDSFRKSEGLGAGFILSVSTLEPRKNLDGLVAGYLRAREVCSSLPELVIVGPLGWGTSPPQVAGVHYVGKVSDGILSGLYASASMLVYVPFEEGFGLPVIEAMRAGLPVVGSEVPSGGSAMEVVDPRSVDSIGAGIAKVYRDSVRRDRLRLDGLARAGQLSWDNTARKHMEVWKDLPW